MAGMLTSNGRYPTFEEKRHFEDELDARIAKYLRENQQVASDPLTVPAFRNAHQVTTGMEKGQVEVLLGRPFATSDDAQQMANWARRHWPEIRGRAERGGLQRRRAAARASAHVQGRRRRLRRAVPVAERRGPRQRLRPSLGRGARLGGRARAGAGALRHDVA